MNDTLQWWLTMAAIFGILGGVIACQKAPEVTAKVGEYKVETLFTHDGCTVYRFLDDRSVYFTNCNGSTQSSHSCGKGCTATDVVPTVRGGY